ncbi:MAG: hypothetical protein JNM57_03055 [Cyclobacteriaceae bacterium]|nr:hypothetical protein [Cyclobacteriaceae bacterium]
MKMIWILLLTTVTVHAQELKWQRIEANTTASFRGLSVVNDSIAWVSGTQGWVGRTTNGGQSWDFVQVPTFDQVDFRSLYAMSKQKAIIANAGSPANILMTADGGQTWRTVYTNAHADAFFDGMSFWNDKEGMIYGDPIGGKLLLLITHDGGESWQEVKQAPVLNTGEASFAASGTGIRCMEKNRVVIATGGKVSRLLRSSDMGKTWRSYSPPILQGEPSTGIFSVAFRNDTDGIVVGGNYLLDSVRTNHVLYTKDGGKKWMAPVVPTRGYRECVEYITTQMVIAVGPSGSDISRDGGMTWGALSDEKGFHVVQKARKGSLVLAAGGKGLIAVLK